MTDEPSFSAQDSLLEDATTPAIAVKISAAAYEVNVWFRFEEIALLPAVLSKPWGTGAVAAGRSAGERVFWSCDDGKVSLLVGHDDQTWDVSVWFSVDAFRRMLAEIQREVAVVASRS